jgi:transposase
MYISRAFWTNKVGKTYESIWLRESYRDSDGKVKNRNIINLKNWPPEAIALLQASLEIKNPASPVRGRPLGSKNKNKNNLNNSNNMEAFYVRPEEILVKQGPSIGALFTVYSVAQKLGIVSALGQDQQAKLAIWQICARVIEQGSRLSAVRMANIHAATSVLNFEQGFTENELYDNLAWLDENQERIEDRLFAERSGKDGKPHLFLYDVTSSYLEGEKNEYAQFGYNRDKKKGKGQIVIGLLCDEKGMPVTVEVFDGNTQDVKTVSSQLQKIRERFGSIRVTLVGDRGMLKSTSLSELSEHEFSYITAITKAQVETLISEGVIEYGLFDTTLCEVEQEGVRYIYRRNPRRAEEIKNTRDNKKARVEKLLTDKNIYLSEHAKSSVEKALEKIQDKIKALKLGKWMTVSIGKENPRVLQMEENIEKLEEESRLDGCYVLKTDLSAEAMTKEAVHERYKELSYVERAFREMKTGQLELRPLHVRSKTSTRAHVLVVMLSYMITRELGYLWRAIDLTVQEGLHSLSTLTVNYMKFATGLEMTMVPQATEQNAKLLEAAGVKIPTYLFQNKVDIHTHKRTKKIS